jgi:hypothetical protein
MAEFCPLCQRKLNKVGFNTSGNQRWRCRFEGCGYSRTDGGFIRGRYPDGDRPMTPYERLKRCRAKKKQSDLEG